MKNLKISGKLTVAFGILVGALLVMAVVSIVSQQRLNATAQLLGKDRRDKLVAVSAIDTATSDYRNAEASSILSTDPEAIRAAEALVSDHAGNIDKNIAYLDGALQNPRAREEFKNLCRDWTTYVSLSKETLALARQNLNDQALANYRQGDAAFGRANKAAANLKKVQIALMDEDMAEAEATYALSRNVSIVVAMLVIGLAIVLLVVLIRGIAKPLGLMTGTMGKLAEGDLSAEVAVDPRRDEVGALAVALVRFRDQLAAGARAKEEQTALIVDNVGSGLAALAKGDLTARIEADLGGPFAKLKDDFNNAMTSVATTLSAVNQSAAGITNGASDIRQASDDLSQRTEQQAASLEETAAAMHEITTTVKETAANATRANQVVIDARRDAEGSEQVVRRAVEAMTGIERSSNEISDIIAVIDGIAFQTNLLALNAGVEAARAGDAGKGFAVVASEVRALAQRSADAAKDVKTKITASTQQVENGVELVSEAGAALTRITGKIGEISTLVADIAAAADQQAIGLQQVNTAVSEMDGVTQQNAAMVEEATAAARSLADETENMSREVARFNLGTETKRAAPIVVHALQARAAQAGRAIASKAARSAAVAVQDDWSSF
ncbi:methyl-accepting chemotaxis protein [Sphingomonas phyllosphaerae]|uniref:methyl-accepting chemotaxis protein n=1 Tax=Sphingomonas phyllosphaerae TaxID=257003 RepID=UPI0003B6677A|nr:methyl-accepting chemotaxis protein [Sphingomonas phyllosphaerae]